MVCFYLILKNILKNIMKKNMTESDKKMEITFYEKNKKVVLSIINYWFPSNNGFDDVENDFYANFLAVKVVYSDGNSTTIHCDRYFTNYRLNTLINSINNLITDKESGFMANFYAFATVLAISVTNVNDIFAFQLRLYYGLSTNPKEIYICQGLDKTKLSEIKNKLQDYSDKFPPRIKR